MTDEEKAEEYAIKITDELKNKGFLTNEEINQRYAGIVQGVLYGLAEGRKEKCLEQNNDGTILPCEVMKENEELKKDKEYLDKVNNEQTEVILKLDEQIEKMKNCRNCEHEYDWEDNEYCVGCLSLFHDHKPKWEMKK